MNRINNLKLKIVKEPLGMNDIKLVHTKKNILINKSAFKNCIININKSSKLNDVRIVINGINNKIIIGENCVLNDCCLYIKGNNNIIKIGNECILKSCYLICRDNDNIIELGNNITTAGNFWGDVILHAIEGTSLIIGNECIISGNIVIRTSDGHSILNNEQIRLNQAQNIKIGNHVWICMNSVILKGVTIADGSIIGTNSVVTHSFINKPTIIGGNPAKEIKKIDNFTWNWKKL